MSSEMASSEVASSSEAAAVASSAPPVESSSSVAEQPSSSSEEQTREVTPTTLTATPPMPAKLVFEATRKVGGSIALKGAVPADATGAYFGVLAGNASTDKLTADTTLPDDFTPNGTAGINALAELSSGHLGFDGTKWWLQGKAEQQSILDDATAKIAALPKGADWSVNVDLLAPIDVCRVRLDALAKRNGIVFKPGNATLMPSSIPVLDELAQDLTLCPKSDVHVQGHTDGDGDADTNLALSVKRAEAVVGELVKRGVSDSRLYAEGFGESDPLVPENTKDAKTKNRRIAFQITEE